MISQELRDAAEKPDPLRTQALSAIRDAEGIVVDVSDAYQHTPQRRIITVTIKPAKLSKENK